MKQKTRACSEPTLRVLSAVLLQQVARPSQTTVEKGVRGGKPETQRENELQCMQYPPKRNLGGAAHGGSRWGEERVVPSRSNPDAFQKKREGGAEEGNQTLFKHHGNLSIAKVRRLFV